LNFWFPTELGLRGSGKASTEAAVVLSHPRGICKTAPATFRVFALQFAQILGARVIATTSREEKAERLKAVGDSDVINYTEMPDWDGKARELMDGRIEGSAFAVTCKIA
jgi:hypothetical protein